MQTTPGSYAVKPINDALERLPIGQMSSVIEGPESFHIVKVESRRPAGPASFEEVQDKIRPKLEAETNACCEMEAFTKEAQAKYAHSRLSRKERSDEKLNIKLDTLW